MARPGVTYLEVAEAATLLTGQGKNPTIEQIRLVIGSGSSTTLATHLRRWKENQQESTLIAGKENIPQELVALVKGLWERLLGHSDERIAVVEETHQKTLGELNQDLQKYKENNQRWQKLLQVWQQEKDKLVNAGLVGEETIASLQKDNANLNNRVDSLYQQLQEKQERVDELQRLHQQAQANLEHYREATREQRLIDQEHHTQLQQQAEQAIKQLQQDLSLARQEKTALQQELVQTSKQKTEAVNKNNALTQERAQVQKQLQKAELNALQWQTEAESLAAKLKEQAGILVALEKQAALTTQQLTTTSAELNNSQRQSKLLAQEKWELAQEKAQLEGQLKQLESLRFLSAPTLQEA